MPARRLDARYSWSWLNGVHRESVVRSLARMFGIPDGATPDVLRAVADRFPLLGGGPEFSWAELIAELSAEPAVVAVADLELGATFRELLTRSDSERVVAEITEYLQREIVGPYLRAGISAVEAGGRIPHLARA